MATAQLTSAVPIDLQTPNQPKAPTKFHLSMNVSDLDRSVAYFEILFGQPAAKCRSDYAKFELDDPPVVFSLEPHAPVAGGSLNHVGFRVSDSARLVEMQRRLELAGIRTQREEGVECCYSRQTKFWVKDPDQCLWEFYVLEEDIEHRGAGQSSERMLPQVSATMSAPEPAGTAKSTLEHCMTEKLAVSIAADDSLDEIRLRGTFNRAEHARQMSEILADAHRALRPGGRLVAHILTADRRVVDDALSLPGPAAAVNHVPVDRELFAALERAGFSRLELTTYRAAPCFHVGPAELRETMVSAHKAVPGPAGAERVILYKGPFAEVTDDEQHVYRRGARVTVSLSTWEALARSPLADQFVCFEPGAGAACGAK